MATTPAPTGRAAGGYRERSGVQIGNPAETRRSYTTTEFFVMIASVAAVIVVGYANDDSLNVFRIWLLVTVLASAYMVSRGIAKAGSYERGSDLEVNRRS
jgi:hypothetical protein